MNDEEFIRKTLSLARRGLGTTWPNPMVGAVIVKDGKILSEGFHLKKGEAHAELDAINKASVSVRGATLYVNLEPCCHTNKNTPPCAQRIIAEGFKKVVICNLDPNPEVNGKGVELLKASGIEVEQGLLSSEGEKLNEVFFLSQRLQRPFIHFKTAATLDGRTALSNGESKWITGEAARNHVQEIRSLHQGIMTGGETVRKDNPRLTVRTIGHNGLQPLRIVFTKTGQLPQDYHLFSDENKHQTLIYTHQKLNFNFPSSQVILIGSLKEALKDLFTKKIVNLMLECGPTLATEFLKEGLIDRVSFYQNPSFIGEGKNVFQNLNLKNLADRPHLKEIDSIWLGEDLLITGRLLKE